eukprot:2849794-Amphidinium_carterae.1
MKEWCQNDAASCMTQVEDWKKMDRLMMWVYRLWEDYSAMSARTLTWKDLQRERSPNGEP